MKRRARHNPLRENAIPAASGTGHDGADRVVQYLSRHGVVMSFEDTMALYALAQNHPSAEFVGKPPESFSMAGREEGDVPRDGYVMVSFDRFAVPRKAFLAMGFDAKGDPGWYPWNDSGHRGTWRKILPARML